MSAWQSSPPGKCYFSLFTKIPFGKCFINVGHCKAVIWSLKLDIKIMFINMTCFCFSVLKQQTQPHTMGIPLTSLRLTHGGKLISGNRVLPEGWSQVMPTNHGRAAVAAWPSGQSWAGNPWLASGSVSCQIKEAPTPPHASLAFWKLALIHDHSLGTPDEDRQVRNHWSCGEVLWSLHCWTSIIHTL